MTVGVWLGSQAVMIHQLSKQATQNPFRKNRGRVQRVLFHPSKPFLLVATQHHVRIYNLAKQALARKLLGSSGAFTCLAIHSSGDHVIAGALLRTHAIITIAERSVVSIMYQKLPKC